MNSIAKTLAAAAMGAVGVLTLVNVASAQTTTDTPAVEAPADNSTDNSAADDAADDHNCPERDGAGSSSGSGTTDSTGTAGSNVGFRRL